VAALLRGRVWDVRWSWLAVGAATAIGLGGGDVMVMVVGSSGRCRVVVSVVW
jgi:hypothetical protein